MKTSRRTRVLLMVLSIFTVMLGILLPAKLAYSSNESTIAISGTPQGDGSGTIQHRVGEGLVDLPSSAIPDSQVTLVVTPAKGCMLDDEHFILLRDGSDTKVEYNKSPIPDSDAVEITFTMPSSGAWLTPYFMYKNPIKVWVGDKRVNTSNCDDVFEDGGSVQYDVQAHTLTLNDATITTATNVSDVAYDFTSAGNTNIISYEPAGLVINLVGNNTIRSTADTGIFVTASSDENGATQELTIVGSGTLTASGMSSTGIYVWKDMVIALSEDGAIDVSASGESSNVPRGIYSGSGTITINNGSVTAYGDENGIAAFKRVNINGGTVTAKAGDNQRPIEVFIGSPTDENIIYVNNEKLEITTPAGARVDGRDIMYHSPYYDNDRPVTGTVVIEPKVEREITVVQADGGTVTAKPEKAFTGDPVTLTITPNEGEHLKSLSITDSDGVDVTFKTIDENRIEFTMPCRAVTVKPMFHDPRITVDFGEGHEDFLQTYLTEYQKYNTGADAFVVSGSKVTYTVEAGKTLQDALAVIVGKQPTHIEEGKRVDKGVYFMSDFALHAVDYYADEAALDAERRNQYSEPAPEVVTFYALWAQPEDDVSITVSPLVCGTEVAIDKTQSGIEYTNPQVEATLTNEQASLDTAFTNNWRQTRDGDLAAFTVKGDTDYYARFTVSSSFGHFFNNLGQSMTVTNDASATKANAEDETITSFGRNIRIVAKVPAVHDCEDWKQTKAPTCTEKGEEKSTCKGCDKEVAREVDALGHDWDEWKQTKAPTCTDTGTEEHACKREGCSKKETHEVSALGHDWDEPTYEWSDDNSTCTATRTCKREGCDGKETEAAKATSTITKEPTDTEEGERTYTATFTNTAFATQTKAVPIPAGEKGPEYYFESGENGEWTKGSNEALDFKIECKNPNASNWNHNVVGVLVDGKQLETKDYDLRFGSVIVSLKPEYLETLAVGEHTLAVEFPDGSVSTKFTVKETDTEKDTETNTEEGTETGTTKRTTGTTGGTSPIRTMGNTSSGRTTSTGTSTSTRAATTPRTGDDGIGAIASLLVGAALACLFGAKRIATQEN